MERLCVSLETAKRLKAAGFPQYSSAVEFWNDMAGAWHIRQSVRNPVATILAAPTAQELADELPECVEHEFPNDLVISRQSPLYFVSYEHADDDIVFAADKNLAEALAFLYLKLHEAQS